MDPKHSGNVLKHLEKQKELLMDAYRSMSHEVHRLQVEEEMLMRKYYEFMTAQDLVDKKTSGDVEIVKLEHWSLLAEKNSHEQLH